MRRISRKALLAGAGLLFVIPSAHTLCRNQEQGRPTPAPLVVQVSTELIQVDAVVTDHGGQPITDLHLDDFEVLEDGQPRRLTTFQYVPLSPGTAHSTASPAGAAIPDRESPAAMGRQWMAVVVDDLSLSFESTVHVRDMVSTLADEALAARAPLAILRTSGGVGALQQFTTDRHQLELAIAGIRFNLRSRGRLKGIVPQVEASVPGTESSGTGGTSPLAAGPPADSTGGPSEDFLERMERERQKGLALGTVDSLEAVVRALGALPGRKALLLVSEGWALYRKVGTGLELTGVQDRVRDLIDAANRSSVVVYSMDPGGLQTLRPSAGDMGGAANLLEGSVGSQEARAGMTQLAEDTGGLAAFDTNDLRGAARRILDDQKGYYLLGYQPEPGSFSHAPGKNVPYHRLRVKVRRPGARVRSRRGYFAVAEAKKAERDPTGFLEALVSPFAAGDLPVRLTALFDLHPKKGSILRCLIHMDAEQLTLTPERDGTIRAKLDATAATLGADGRIGERVGGKYTLHLSRAEAAAARRGGLVLTLDLRVKQPGPYQVRASVRDEISGRSGWANQFVIAPKLRDRHLALSGIVMSGADAVALLEPGGPGSPEIAVDPGTTPAVRRFHAGATVAYAFAAYNCARAPETGKPALSVRLNLYRDGRLVQTVPEATVSVAPKTGGGAVGVGGTIRLGQQMQPDIYTLEVLVNDTTTTTRAQRVAQWLDFEIVS